MKEMLTNKILTGLPDVEFTRLMPLLEPVSLSAGDRLAEAGETARFAYFPENSVISCHADMQDGKSVEFGMVGSEGMGGLASLLSYRPASHSLNVLTGGSALRMKMQEVEREFRRGEGLHELLLSYAGEYLMQTSQRAACPVLHKLEQRLAVWLLMLSDRLDGNTIEMTQERIAQHLGVRRAGVTVVANELQHRGAISYTRGSLRIVNRQVLKTTACECYGVLTGAHQKNTYM